MWVILQSTSAPVPPVVTGGYGAALLQAVLALLAVTALAWVVLRGLSRGGILRGSGRIRVLERTPLDARHALVLVQVDGETLLLGVGDGSAPTLIQTLPKGEDAAAQHPTGGQDVTETASPGSVAASVSSARQSFSAALARAKLLRATDSSREPKNDV